MKASLATISTIQPIVEYNDKYTCIDQNLDVRMSDRLKEAFGMMP